LILQLFIDLKNLECTLLRTYWYKIQNSNTRLWRERKKQTRIYTRSYDHWPNIQSQFFP